MSVTAGTLVLASEYNTVAELVNKIFGDKYDAVLVTDADRSNHKFGWGAVNIEDALADGTLITAERLQDMINRTNIFTKRKQDPGHRNLRTNAVTIGTAMTKHQNR